MKIENFIPQTYQDTLERVMLSLDFPWFYNTQTSVYSGNDLSTGSVFLDNNTEDKPQFIHIFYENGNPTSNYFGMVQPMIYLLEQKIGKTISNNIFRIKANLLYQDSSYAKDMHNIIHIDTPSIDESYKSFLYYVNSSDGDTLVYNETVKDKPKCLTIKTKNTPEKGTGLFFDSDVYHCSTPPVITKTRVVINFVLKETQNDFR